MLTLMMRGCASALRGLSRAFRTSAACLVRSFPAPQELRLSYAVEAAVTADLAAQLAAQQQQVRGLGLSTLSILTDIGETR